MAVFRGSRYAGVNATVVTDADGNERLFLHNRKEVVRNDIGREFTVNKFVEGDELDAIAFRIGGRARAYWVIADVNEIFHPIKDVVPNLDIIIPSRRIFRKF